MVAPVDSEPKEPWPGVDQLIEVLIADVDDGAWGRLTAAITRYVGVEVPPRPAPRPLHKCTVLTTDERAEVVARYLAGEPVADICHDYNIHKTTLIRIWQNAGAPKRQRNFTPEQKGQALVLYQEGLNFSEIGRRLRVSKDAVRACVRRWEAEQTGCSLAGLRNEG